MTTTTPLIGLNAHLLAAEAGYRRAGIHSYIWNLLNELPAAAPEWRYRVFVGSGTPPHADRFEVRRARLNTARPALRILWEQAAQPFQLGKLDLVHELAFVAPLIMPRPFVVTVYDLSFVRYPERLTRVRRWYLRLLTGITCQRARRVLAISQSTADDLVRLLGVPPERIDLALPGIDPRFRPLPAAEIAAWRAKHDLPERFLLFVGTLEPRKNLPVLLRAYAALPAALRQACQLVLAGGTGWMAKEIHRTIAENGLSSTVRMPGFVADDDLIWYYNAAEALVYPSLFEGWGMPVTEAMACGKPALVSDVSSLPEAVGETGLRLPPQGVSAWTEALRRCIEDADWRAAAGQQASLRAAQFTWRRTAENTVTSYRRALNN